MAGRPTLIVTRPHQSIRIARGAARFILLQRTQLQSKQLRHAFSRMRLRYIPVGLYLEGWLRRRAIEQAYVREIEADFQSIKPYLPATAASIMDIGCGIAALDALLFEHYGEQEPVLYLVDRSELSGRIYFGFRGEAAFYNSLGRAKRTLLVNGVPHYRIRTIEAPGDELLPNVAPLDLVISILSWGFHFPISTYLNCVCDCLAPNGRLIVDVRRNTDGLERLAACFSDLSIISEMPKAQRVCAQRLR
jgi:SAM-dependent methyltransferase